MAKGVGIIQEKRRLLRMALAKQSPIAVVKFDPVEERWYIYIEGLGS